MAVQCPATQAAVPSTPVRRRMPARRVAAGGGQGSASRSIFPEVRVGSVSTTASRGTSAAGIEARSRSTAALASKPGSVVT